MSRVELWLADDRATEALGARLAAATRRQTGGVVWFTPEMRVTYRPRHTLKALAGQVAALSQRQPVLLVFEDIHWADQGLIDFIDHLAEWSVGHPILLVTLARPGRYDVKTEGNEVVVVVTPRDAAPKTASPEALAQAVATAAQARTEADAAKADAARARTEASTVKASAAADKREAEWRKKSGKIWDRYRQKSVKQHSYNILWSNTETLRPSVYNSLPQPDVRRRFKDEDKLGKAVSEVIISNG